VFCSVPGRQSRKITAHPAVFYAGMSNFRESCAKIRDERSNECRGWSPFALFSATEKSNEYCVFARTTGRRS